MLEDEIADFLPQIERATLVDLDWAFANMKSSAKTSASATSGLTLDADVKGAGKELGELKGLETLLFDDSKFFCTRRTKFCLYGPNIYLLRTGPPDVEEASDIQKMLNEIGVGYTHRNDQLIRSNAVEELRVEALIEVSTASDPR